MTNHLVSLSLITKRKNCLALNQESHQEVQWLIESATKESKGEVKTSYAVREFFEKCRGSNANKHYKRCINLLENFHDGTEKNESLCNTLTNSFLENVLPYITNLSSLDQYMCNRKIGEERYNKIHESVKLYKICDRVINNHEKISKRFNVRKYINENTNLPLDHLVYNICEFIDTYNMPDYAKLNTSIEECFYVFESCEMNYSNRKLLSSITDYFLLRESYISENVLLGYKKVLNDNKFISKKTRKDVSFLLESGEFADSNDVMDLINQFKKDEQKDMSKLKYIVNRLFTKSPDEIIDDLPSMFGLLRGLTVLGTFGIQPIIGIVLIICDKCVSVFLEHQQAQKTLSYFKREKTNVEKRIEKCKNQEQLQSLNKYNDCLSKCIEKLEEHCENTGGNIEEESYKCLNLEYISLNEFKLFKQQNLLTAALKANNIIELNYNRIKKFGNKAGKKIKGTFHKLVTPTKEERREIESKKISTKIKNTISNTKDNIVDAYNDAKTMFNLVREANDLMSEDELLSMINNDDEIDIIISTIENPEDDNNLISEFANIINELNTTLVKDNCHCYLLPNGFALEFHLVSNEKINLTSKERELKEHTMPNYYMYYINNIFNITESVENYINVITESPNVYKDLINEINPSIDYEQVKTMLEIYSISPESNKAVLDRMIDYYCESYDDFYIKYNELHYVCDNLINTNLSLDESTEVYNLGKQLLTEGGIDTNSIKLAMIKLKKKVVNLGTKEKEISRNMDIAVNGLTRGIEKALTTDKRESIIKGSIIPSFSKLIKMSITTGATFCISPVVAVIGLIGGLAVSKHLTERERSMLLDEIEVELKVVDREIQRCEGDGKPEKYRTLLQYQRQLQREKQRIKYNLTVKGREVPDVGKYVDGGDD